MYKIGPMEKCNHVFQSALSFNAVNILERWVPQEQSCHTQSGEVKTEYPSKHLTALISARKIKMTLEKNKVHY